MGKATVSSFAWAPGDLRQIVLDYLCDNCYADTAQVLAHESSTRELDKDGDEVLTGAEYDALDPELLRVVKLRKEIKTRLLAGRIADATEKLNLHFPAVLAPAAAEPRFDPSHLFLNLKIQNFIEQARTVPLPWPADPAFAPARAPFPPSKPAAAVDLAEAEDAARKDRLLRLMEELYALTHALPAPKDRATYLAELATVGGLLAYHVPETSAEMRKYLNMARREAVADQINDAILFRTNVTLPSAVERIVSHTTILFSTLNSINYTLPPPDQRPPGTEPFLCAANSVSPRGSKDPKVTKENDSRQVVPKFELERFLGSDP